MQSHSCTFTAAFLNWLSSLILIFKRVVFCLSHFYVSLLNSHFHFSVCSFIHHADQLLPRLCTVPDHILVILQCSFGVCWCFRIILFGTGSGQDAYKMCIFSPLYLICIDVGVSRQESEQVFVFSLWRKLRYGRGKASDKPKEDKAHSAVVRGRKEGIMTGSQVLWILHLVDARMEVGDEHPRNPETWSCSAGSVQTLESCD